MSAGDMTVFLIGPADALFFCDLERRPLRGMRLVVGGGETAILVGVDLGEGSLQLAKEGTEEAAEARRNPHPWLLT